MQPEEESRSVTLPQEEQVENRLINAFEAIRFNIREGQKQKGKLTLQDCRLLIPAEKKLGEFLKKLSEQESAQKGKEEAADGDENSGDKIYATDEVYAAYRVILASLEVLQTTGIFTIEGSVELVEWMEEIALGLDKVKDPVIRMRELKEKTKGSSKDKDGKKSSKKK